MPVKASIPPRVVAASVLSAWRREALVASDLVNSSNWFGSMLPPFELVTRDDRDIEQVVMRGVHI